MRSPKLVEPGKKYCRACWTYRATFTGKWCQTCVDAFKKQSQ